ncbi:MAG: hypothetical protein IT374_01685 [Polyangiaceae bacterium]|nr:hypothetical protein [Polyangiaceae bacterium]
MPLSPVARSARRGASILTLLTAALASVAACGGSDGEVTSPGGSNPGGGGKAGTGTGGGSNTGGKAAAGGGTGASAGGCAFANCGGSGGSTGGGTSGGNGGKAGSSASGGASGKGGANTGGTSTGGAGGACVKTPGTPGPIQGKPRPAVDNECDATKLPPGWTGIPEGTSGNGFDDDGDGLVDEGCDCPGAGATKDCYSVPSTRVDPQTKLPVGICKQPGKVACTAGEFGKAWSGYCIGTVKPDAEVCTPGDRDCDGLEKNPAEGCECIPQDPLLCPTGPIYTTPFPDPKNVGQFSAQPNDPKSIDGIDGATWFDPKILDPKVAGNVTNWRWTVVGGPCDDILPHPTFALFPTKDTTGDFATTHLGTETNLLPQIPDKGQPDPTKPAGTRQGYVAQGGTTPAKLYPAFSLSGDYYVTGKFTYKDPLTKQDKEGQCTQLVKVRAPGLRVELCWPEVGWSGNAGSPQTDNDVDLHVARLQGNPSGNGKHGWFDAAGVAPNSDDCYYSPNSACGNRTKSGVNATPGWYSNEITNEPGNTGVCHGWGSRRFSTRPCASPRLDRDNLDCDPAIADPNAPEQDPGQVGENYHNFCGPENINLDGQVLKSGDRFAIGVQCYNCVQGSNGAANAKPARPRVNVYCDGELKYYFGYDPAALMSKPDQYPQLWTEGQRDYGSMWQVGVVNWKGDPKDPCAIEPSEAASKWNKDSWHQKSNGSQFICVNNGPRDNGGASFNPGTAPTNWLFKADGSYPTAASDMCAN